MFHEVGFLAETGRAENARVGPHTRVGSQVHIQIGFGGENSPADRTPTALLILVVIQS